MRRILTSLLWAVLVPALASCSLRQPAVQTADYAFDLPAPARGPTGEGSVAVLPFSAGPRASGQMLLYRADDLRYEHDFYNRFLAPPPRMLTGALRRYLSLARVGQVREPGAPSGADLIVQPRLTELYADYRDQSQPRATVAMVLVLIRHVADGNKELFERTYRRSIPLRAVSPAAAVEGWSEGIGQIFGEFTRDLRRAW